MHKVIGIAVLAFATASYAGGHGGGHGGGHSSGHGSHSAHATALTGDHYVAPYVTKSGKYVQGHYETNPNDTKLDNYSTKGNVNPYTGKPGWIDPYAPKTALPSGSN